MQNGDEASPSIILADRALLVKMLITLGPHGIFCSNFVNLCILTLPSHWFTTFCVNFYYILRSAGKTQNVIKNNGKCSKLFQHGIYWWSG